VEGAFVLLERHMRGRLLAKQWLSGGVGIVLIDPSSSNPRRHV